MHTLHRRGTAVCLKRLVGAASEQITKASPEASTAWSRHFASVLVNSTATTAKSPASLLLSQHSKSFSNTSVSLNPRIVSSTSMGRAFSTQSQQDDTTTTKTTTKTETPSEGESTDTSTSQSTESVFAKVADFTRSEVRNLAEVIKASQSNLRIPKRRLLKEGAVPYEKLDDEDIATMDPAHRPKAKADAERAARAALWHSQGRIVPNPTEMSSIPVSEDAKPEEQEGEEVVVERKEVMVLEQSKGTVWGERIASIKETIFGSFRRSVRSVNRAIDESENTTVSKIREAKYVVQDKIEDFRETYETSQHPLVWKLRDVHDRATMGSEAAMATERLNMIDPTYNEDDLKKDLEEYLIPVLVGAILKGDAAVIRSLCGGQALAGVLALFQERATRGVKPDSLILDVAHVEISPPTLVNDVPHVKVSFSCQQVNCLRNAKGEIVEGGETDIARVMYVLMLKREFDNPDTDWRTVQLYMQQVLALV